MIFNDKRFDIEILVVTLKFFLTSLKTKSIKTIAQIRLIGSEGQQFGFKYKIQFKSSLAAIRYNKRILNPISIKFRALTVIFTV